MLWKKRLFCCGCGLGTAGLGKGGGSESLHELLCVQHGMEAQQSRIRRGSQAATECAHVQPQKMLCSPGADLTNGNERGGLRQRGKELSQMDILLACGSQMDKPQRSGQKD